MRHHRLLIYVIGIFLNVLNVDFARAQEAAEEFSGTPGMVLVEPTNVVTSEVGGEYRLVPYLERRNRWGFTVSIGYNSFEPIYYELKIGPLSQRETDFSKQIGLGVAVNRKVVYIGQAHTGFLQAIANRFRRKPRPMFDTPKAFFLSCRYELPIPNQAGGRVAVVRVDA